MMNNMTKYSVRVKNGAGWRTHPTIRLMISVGQPYHEEQKLEAVVDWINRNPNIKKVHVSVNDLLQRYNYIADGFDKAKSARIALSEGSLWLARNDAILKNIKAKTLITRWNDWISKKDFQTTFNCLHNYSFSDPNLLETLGIDSNALLERRKTRNEYVSHETSFIQCSQNYIKEELAVFALQSSHIPAAEVYPGSNLASAKSLLGKKLPKEIASLSDRYFTRIDFARKKVAKTKPSYIMPSFEERRST